MASEQSWKNKYQQVLKEAEQQEQQCKEQRDLLERMLVRTSVASEGQRPELDRLLNQLRADLRRKTLNAKKWLHLQEQIDRQIALLDEKPAPPHDETAAPTPSFPAPPNDGIDISDQDHRLLIARHVGQLLSKVLEQVTLEPEAEAKAKELQQTLLSSIDWSTLRTSLESVSELLIRAITRNQRELEAFLTRLNARLETLREHFSQQSDCNSSRKDDTAILDREIRGEIDLVSEDLRVGADLDTLKYSVGKRLDQIASALGRFKDKETERESWMAEQLESMQQKMAAMEASSEQMQEQIRRERARAMTDLLTQLPNREAWQERLHFEYNRWQRYGHPLTVSVVDIDLFKRVNDTYGHKAGDRVLQLVARELQGRLRATDFIARIGGEEFALLLPETSMNEAVSVLNKLRGYVEKLPFHFGGNPVSITFSSGLAQFVRGDSEDNAFDRADRALYRAKATGRNRVVAN
ncbi:diguanylate cyclase [Marinobacter sp. AL4B]|uniref:sensor domain-containing diguanylate cyclase n=1 Tax=Marinobacter sp. AL4B TaxID=2871173 RepID=UPI001CAA5A1D|nr:diguanylate cyclase [Marinobacter sp. AL4B]MBZ0335702.1 GGDEF domain-containing protein [Marinobacter sp. AL4B]